MTTDQEIDAIIASVAAQMVTMTATVQNLATAVKDRGLEVTGPQGDVGPKGDRGEKGPKGDPGKDGVDKT